MARHVVSVVVVDYRCVIWPGVQSGYANLLHYTHSFNGLISVKVFNEMCVVSFRVILLCHMTSWLPLLIMNVCTGRLMLCIFRVSGKITMSFSSDEVNYLVYRYLLESGCTYSYPITSFPVRCELLQSACLCHSVWLCLCLSLCLFTYLMYKHYQIQCILPLAMTGDIVCFGFVDDVMFSLNGHA